MQEIELKLTLLEDNPQALHEHPLVNYYCKESPLTFDLNTTYYDTEDYQLLKAGIAMRIRENEDGEFIQTIKTKATQAQGLHQREEWDVKLNSNVLNLDVVEPVEVRQKLQEISKQHKIVPIFQTGFARTKWLLDLPNQCQVELVMDLGEVRTETASIPLHEIELELVQGKSVDCLFELAANIAANLPVAVEDRSKAWRGYQLHQAVKAGKVYQEPVSIERQAPEFFLEQAALWRGASSKSDSKNAR
jgi:inorganic triphosphatase YgiF